MFFIALPKERGRTNAALLGEVEKYLIAVGEAANPNLSNVQGRSREGWAIRGVVRGGRGRVTRDAHEFKRMMGL